MTSPTPNLTIWGAHGDGVWIENDGEYTHLTRRDLTAATRYQCANGCPTNIAGVVLDESDVAELTRALNGPQLDDCADCEQAGLIVIEGRPMCLGHVAGFGAAEDRA